MKIIGLTGGMGSGKTSVANLFKELGVPIYIADEEAKGLTNRSKVIKRKLIALLGEEAYLEGHLNRKFVASRIFNDKQLLLDVNAIIHPKVRSHFKRWILKQKGKYCIKEAAILFENGGYKECDKTILVVAPKEIRIKRIEKRDNLTLSQILERMDNQWDDGKKIPLADFVIHNENWEITKKEVAKIHKSILNFANS